MRTPSLIFAMMTAGVLYFLGKEIHSPLVGCVSAVFLALSTFHQQYAQAATMYTMAGFLVALSAYGFIAKKKKLAIFASLGAMLTHYFAFFLTIPIVLFFYRDIIIGKKELFLLGFIACLLLPIIIPGLVFHLSRITLHYWWFQFFNLYLHLSPLLLAGFVFYSYQNISSRKTGPVIIMCLAFVVFSIILIPFVRYLEVFLPLFFVFGVSGLFSLAEKYHFSCLTRRQIPIAIVVVFLLLLTFLSRSFGIYPYQSSLVDVGDTIFTEEWKEIVETIAATGRGGNIMTSRTIPFRYYADLKGIQYHISDEAEWGTSKAIEERAPKDWIILHKSFASQAFFERLDNSTQYERYASFRYTVLFRKHQPATQLEVSSP